jgi:hypothetical protein
MTDLIHFEASAIVGAKAKTGLVNVKFNDVEVQMDIAKTREVIGMLQNAMEAAISDGLFFTWLTDKMGFTWEQAGAALLDWREMRQGSRGVVRPH